jgi:hypothetical protein
VLEFHSRDELSRLTETNPDASLFRLHGIDCYPRVCSADMPFLLNQGYEYLILDMGTIREADIPELLRCDARYVIFSTAPWKERAIEEFLSYFDDTISLGESFHYLMQTGCSRKALTFSNGITIPARACRPIPFIKNPFCIDKELFWFFESLL